MDNRKWEADAIASPPTAPTSPSDGFPTNGNPQTAQNATEPGAWWFHAVGEELRAVIQAGGLTPNHTTLTQLRDALSALGLRAASETQTGVVELATVAEISAGDASRATTAAVLIAGLLGAGTAAANGYATFPYRDAATGVLKKLIIQWGNVNSSGPASNNAAQTFPIAFPTSCLNSYATPFGNGGDLSNLTIQTLSDSLTQFKGTTLRNGAIVTGVAVRWLSIGY